MCVYSSHKRRTLQYCDLICINALERDVAQTEGTCLISLFDSEKKWRKKNGRNVAEPLRKKKRRNLAEPSRNLAEPSQDLAELCQ